MQLAAPTRFIQQCPCLAYAKRIHNRVNRVCAPESSTSSQNEETNKKKGSKMNRSAQALDIYSCHLSLSTSNSTEHSRCWYFLTLSLAIGSLRHWFMTRRALRSETAATQCPTRQRGKQTDRKDVAYVMWHIILPFLLLFICEKWSCEALLCLPSGPCEAKWVRTTFHRLH